jgi:hypothetical protein
VIIEIKIVDLMLGSVQRMTICDKGKMTLLDKAKNNKEREDKTLCLRAFYARRRRSK